MVQTFFRVFIQIPLLIMLVMCSRWTAYAYPKCAPMTNCAATGADFWALAVLLSLGVLIVSAVVTREVLD